MKYKVFPLLSAFLLFMGCNSAMGSGPVSEAGSEQNPNTAQMLSSMYMEDSNRFYTNDISCDTAKLDWSAMYGAAQPLALSIRSLNHSGQPVSEFVPIEEGYLGVRVYFIVEGKEIELEPFSPFNYHISGSSIEEALDILGFYQELNAVAPNREDVTVTYIHALHPFIGKGALLVSCADKEYIFPLSGCEYQSGIYLKSYLPAMFVMNDEVDSEELEQFLDSYIEECFQHDLILQAGTMYSWHDEILPYIMQEFELYKKAFGVLETNYSAVQIELPAWQA